MTTGLPPRAVGPARWLRRGTKRMSVPVLDSNRAPAGRERVLQPLTNRVRRDGKFFRLGADKFYVKGVTYGPFAPNGDGDPLPDPAQVRRDFGQIRELGAN